MNGLDKITPVINACLSNAEHLLNVARVARGPEQNHIAYHLAALALEEVGKASMLGIDSLRRSRVNKTEGPDDEERRPADWIEDHERKLFWALFTPMFGRQPNAAE